MAGSKKGRTPPRRVPGAPRTISTRSVRHGDPWYRRPGVRVAIGLAAAVVVVVVLVLVNRSRDRAAALERRQERVESFSDDTLLLLQKISAPAGEMVTTTVNSKSLEKNAKRWSRTLTAAQQEATATVSAAPPELDAANRLIFQAILQYIAAAKTYELVPQATGDLRGDILERASAQVAAADGTWTAGIVVLDQVRTKAELDPTGMRAPSQVAPPSPSPTPPGG